MMKAAFTAKSAKGGTVVKLIQVDSDLNHDSGFLFFPWLASQSVLWQQNKTWLLGQIPIWIQEFTNSIPLEPSYLKLCKWKGQAHS